MKKVASLLLLFVLTFSVVLAQNNDAYVASLKRRIAKSDKLIKDPKKSQDYRVWAKRGKLMLDAYETNIKYIGPGVEANIIPLLGIEEGQPYYGKPKEIQKKDGKEYWVYDKVTFIIKDGVVQGWKITKPVVDEPLIKAYEAYTKAIQLDPKGKFVKRSSTKKQLAKLRDFLRNSAIDLYVNGHSKKALDYLEKAMALYKYPRMKDDTVNMKPGSLEYYAGVFAYNAGIYDKADKYLKEAIANNYEVGNSYEMLASALEKQGRGEEAVKLLEEGAKKYPTESKIIFSLIDYYKPHGEYQKAFKYIDKAIKLNPNMAILYLVKADAYNQIYNDLSKQYEVLYNESDSLKKAAFRVRYKKNEHQKVLAKKQAVDAKKDSVGALMNKYFDLSVDWFNKGISKDPKNADAYYSLGALYYNRGMQIFQRAQKVPTTETDEYNKLMTQYKSYLRKALTQFEQAYKLNPTDVQTMQNLSIIYYKLGMYDKHKEMKQKIVEQRTKEQQQKLQQQKTQKQQQQQQQNN